jgi:hypothetical protein
MSVRGDGCLEAGNGSAFCRPHFAQGGQITLCASADHLYEELAL